MALPLQTGAKIKDLRPVVWRWRFIHALPYLKELRAEQPKNAKKLAEAIKMIPGAQRSFEEAQEAKKRVTDEYVDHEKDWRAKQWTKGELVTNGEKLERLQGILDRGRVKKEKLAGLKKEIEDLQKAIESSPPLEELLAIEVEAKKKVDALEKPKKDAQERFNDAQTTLNDWLGIKAECEDTATALKLDIDHEEQNRVAADHEFQTTCDQYLAKKESGIGFKLSSSASKGVRAVRKIGTLMGAPPKEKEGERTNEQRCFDAVPHVVAKKDKRSPETIQRGVWQVKDIAERLRRGLWRSTYRLDRMGVSPMEAESANDALKKITERAKGAMEADSIEEYVLTRCANEPEFVTRYELSDACGALFALSSESDAKKKWKDSHPKKKGTGAWKREDPYLRYAALVKQTDDELRRSAAAYNEYFIHYDEYEEYDGEYEYDGQSRHHDEASVSYQHSHPFGDYDAVYSHSSPLVHDNSGDYYWSGFMVGGVFGGAAIVFILVVFCIGLAFGMVTVCAYMQQKVLYAKGKDRDIYWKANDEENDSNL